MAASFARLLKGRLPSALFGGGRLPPAVSVPPVVVVVLVRRSGPPAAVRAPAVPGSAGFQGGDLRSLVDGGELVDRRFQLCHFDDSALRRCSLVRVLAGDSRGRGPGAPAGIRPWPQLLLGSVGINRGPA